MTISSIFLFLFSSVFMVASWRAANYYFEIEENRMGWISIFLSALNAAAAASIIF